jgi:hypothetical protein
MRKRFMASVLCSIIAIALGTIPTAHSSYECKCECNWVCSTRCDSKCTGCSSVAEAAAAIDSCCESKRSPDTLPCLTENSY